MPYQYTEQGLALQDEVKTFMDDHIYPNEAEYYEQLEEGPTHGYPPILDKLKAAAKERGLWNLFLPHLAPDAPGTKLSNLDYSPISEQLGKVTFSSEVLNCQAPDTGNMEILNLYGSETVKRDWLAPLLEGEMRSAFSMTEPEVASSDATNIGLRIERVRRPLRPQRQEVVQLGRAGRPLQGPDRDGQDRPFAPPATASSR